MRILVICRGGPEHGWNEFVDVDEKERLIYFHHRTRPGSIYEITDEEADSPLGRARVAVRRED